MTRAWLVSAEGSVGELAHNPTRKPSGCGEFLMRLCSIIPTFPSYLKSQWKKKRATFRSVHSLGENIIQWKCAEWAKQAQEKKETDEEGKSRKGGTPKTGKYYGDRFSFVFSGRECT